MKDDAMRGIAKKRLARCHGLENSTLAFDVEVALIIIPPTLFSPGVAASLQNMVLRAQTHMGLPALGGFVIKAAEVTVKADDIRD